MQLRLCFKLHVITKESKRFYKKSKVYKVKMLQLAKVNLLLKKEKSFL